MAVAVVTGAGSGIGRATVRALQSEGMLVVALDIDGEAAAEASPHSFALDVADADAVERTMAHVLGTWSSVDVLVNNAGITGSADATVLDRTPVAEFDRVFAVNVRGPFLCSRAILPAMVAAGHGLVVTIASVAGLIAFPGRCAYTASKGAALQLARSIAVDYGPSGVRSVAVCPGMVETPMTQWRLDQPDLRAKVEARIPLGRVATPDEIADAVALLAIGRLAYANGAPLVVDGGWSSS